MCGHVLLFNSERFEPDWSMSLMIGSALLDDDEADSGVS